MLFKWQKVIIVSNTI